MADVSFLKTIYCNRDSAIRHLVAVCGGLLLSIAFPPMEIAGAAWIAPGLILFSAMGLGGWRAFRLGFVAGFAHFLSSLYWLLWMPDSFHGIPLAPAAAWIALSAYCALYPAVWVWLCWRIFAAAPASPGDSLRGSIDRFFTTHIFQRTGWSFSCGLIWVALELARGRLLTGFPWNFLGVSQYKMLPLIQIASVTGVLGVSFVIVWMSVSLAVAMIALTRKPGRGVWGEAGLPLFAVVLIGAYGTTKVFSIPPSSEELGVAMIQPDFPQTVIWDPGQDSARLQTMIELSEKALAGKARLLLWPESALASLSTTNQEALAGLLAKHPVWLIASIQDTEVSSNGMDEDFNSGIEVSPDGMIQDVYHKRRLVIFGEYVPPWLGWLKWMTPIDGSFTPGRDAVQFKMKNPDAQISMLICFEDVFPEEAREHVTPDTDFLVNLTNDGWFGKVGEQWQHVAGAVFRAIENGVPLVRCTNNGLTCWIDAQGRLRAIFSAGASEYGAGYMTVRIPLRPPGARTQTIYNRYGDWCGWSCCGMSLCLVAGSFLRRPETSQE